MARASKAGSGNLKAQGTQQDSSFVAWFFRPSMLFRFSLVAGVVALWPYAAQRLPSLSKRPEYRLTFQQIRISPLPERPVPEELVEQVEKLANLPNEISILEEGLTADIAFAFTKHPWISKVVRVQKSFPTAVTVELEYRKPVAMVSTSNGPVPIDVNGVVLPASDFSKSDSSRYPAILNVISKPPASAGLVWNDVGLIAAARLASHLESKWSSLKLEAISVPRNPAASDNIDDVTLELVAVGGSKILWGRTPGSNYPGELETPQKIRRLENYLTEFGDYTQPNGPYEIDIRHWRENSRRPLASEQSQTKPFKNPKGDSPRLQNSEGKRRTRS